MCVIALAYQTASCGQLLLLANRDEAYARQTAALDRWPEHPGMLAGKDLQAGGSWLAIDDRGRFAAVTHIREGYPKPGANLSRGELVRRFVTGNESSLEFADWLRSQLPNLAPFNLIFGDIRNLLHFNSRQGRLTRLSPGIHALSNADLDTPWFKAEQLRAQLQNCKRIPPEQDMLRWLSDPTPAPVERLPNTGVGLAMEKTLSPVFIVGRDYGTRASSIITVSNRGDIGFTEVSWGLGGRETGRRRHTMRIDPTRINK